MAGMTGTAGKKKSAQNNRGSDGKQYPSRWWILLAVVSFFLLIGTLFGHADEISLKLWAHSITADYIVDGENTYAEYYDEEGTLHTYNLNSYSPVHEGDKITLYYASDVDEAIPENSPLSWLMYYIPYGALFGLSMWQIRKITHPKKA